MRTKRENKSPWTAYHTAQREMFDACHARAKELEAERYAKAKTMSDAEAVNLAEEHHEALRKCDETKPQD